MTEQEKDDLIGVVWKALRDHGGVEPLIAVAEGIMIWSQGQMPGSFSVSTASAPTIPPGKVTALAQMLKDVAPEFEGKVR